MSLNTSETNDSMINYTGFFQKLSTSSFLRRLNGLFIQPLSCLDTNKGIYIVSIKFSNAEFGICWNE